MKVSFSLQSSKDSSKPSNTTLPSSSSNQHHHSKQKELITEFDPSKTLTDPTSKTPILIPPIPNEWNPQNQPMNIDPPVQSDDPIQHEITNGIKSTCDSDPLSSIDRLMLMKLRSDLKRLPEHRGLEEYEDVPVKEFARAYMKGYGWCEGKGIGKNAKEDVKVVEYTNRAAGEGLGFVRTDDSDHKGVQAKKCVNYGGKRAAFCDRK